MFFINSFYKVITKSQDTWQLYLNNDYLNVIKSIRPSLENQGSVQYWPKGAHFWKELRSGTLTSNFILLYFGQGQFSSVDCHCSNLLLIAQDVMQLLVNHQLIPFSIWPKSFSSEQSWCKRSETIVVTSLYCCIIIVVSKNKSLKWTLKCAAN